jgi:ankyrin repeat protein
MLIRTKQLVLYLDSNFRINYIGNKNLEEIFYTCGIKDLLSTSCGYYRQGNNYADLNRSSNARGYFTKENIDKLETYGFPFRDYKIPCKLIDKDKQINKEDELIKVIHPLIVKRILNYYVTKLNKRKSEIINSRNEVMPSASDF